MSECLSPSCMARGVIPWHLPLGQFSSSPSELIRLDGMKGLEFDSFMSKEVEGRSLQDQVAGLHCHGASFCPKSHWRTQLRGISRLCTKPLLSPLLPASLPTPSLPSRRLWECFHVSWPGQNEGWWSLERPGHYNHNKFLLSELHQQRSFLIEPFLP